MATALVQVRVDEDLKNQATVVYDALGIDLSTAIRIFLKRSGRMNGVPFSMTLSNSELNQQPTVQAPGYEKQ